MILFAGIILCSLINGCRSTMPCPHAFTPLPARGGQRGTPAWRVATIPYGNGRRTARYRSTRHRYL